VNNTNIEIHPIALLLPAMSAEEYTALCNDIRERGLNNPIWLYENKILDGRHRYKACIEMKVEPRFQVYAGTTPVQFVLSENLHRRHLTSSQRGALAVEVEKYLAPPAAERQKTLAGTRPNRTSDLEETFPQGQQSAQKRSPQSRDQAAELVRTNSRYVSDAKKLAAEAPDLFEQVKSGEKTIPEAKKEVKKRANQQARSTMAAHAEMLPELSSRNRIECADFREYLWDVPENSVDLIFTDPPYDSESLHLYLDLAIHAARILKPGGSLLSYCGHYAIPEITHMLGQHLRYWWLIALSHQSGNHRRLEGKKVYVHWKPLLWYVKDTYLGKRAVADLMETKQPSKQLHDWEQDISIAQYYIDYLTNPDDFVIDPMCGSGTICRAALQTGRRSLGIEINQERANIAKVTLHELSSTSGNA
jgi:ParB-like chromosome segregation protein Spo0J